MSADFNGRASTAREPVPDPYSDAYAETDSQVNPFAPIDASKRITGRAHRRASAAEPTTPPPLTPGSSYSFGEMPLTYSFEAPRDSDIPDYLRDDFRRPSAETRVYPPVEFNQQPVSDGGRYDPWEMMGWKRTEEEETQYTPMFEQDAFGEPLQPTMDEDFAASFQTQEWQEAPEPAYAPVQSARQPMLPYPPEQQPHVPPMRMPQAEQPQQPTQTAERPKVRPWRLALLLCCVLAVLFCLIDVAKIVHSLWRSERDSADTRREYYAMAGVDPSSGGSRVELLPAGETFRPAETSAPTATPKATARINQNDPLIGVMDNGGATPTPFEAALPTPTSAVRSKPTSYPNNPLLNENAAFADRRAENSDVVAEVSIDGLLSENVVMRNNTFYLTHNWRGTFGASGAVFIDESCAIRKPPENLILRGQAVKAGKLFEPLTQYGTADADFVAQHSLITCNTLYENAQYIVFAVVHADSVATSADYFNYAGYASFQSDTQMLSYVSAAKQRSVFNIEVDVQADDRLLTLATLGEGSDTYSWVLLCRKLRDGETPTNVKIERKSAAW